MATEAHPYLQAKGIKPHGMRVLAEDLIINRDTFENVEPNELSECLKENVFTACRNSLIIVAYNNEMEPQGIQFISPNEPYNKYSLPGSRMKGHFGVVDGKTDLIYFVEGVATGCSINEISGRLVIVTFGKSNLISAIESTLKFYPKDKHKFIIAADNDSGIKTAKSAALQYNIPYTYPIVEGGTDFNDLHKTQGGRAVEQQLKDNIVYPGSYEENKHEENLFSQSDNTGSTKKKKNRKATKKEQFDHIVKNAVVKGAGLTYVFTCDKDDGVVHHKITYPEGQRKITSTPVCSFLEVVARVRNKDEKEWGRILKIHTINNVCHIWNISTDLLSGDCVELRKGLLKLGLDIKTGKYIHDYLTQYIY